MPLTGIPGSDRLARDTEMIYITLTDGQLVPVTVEKVYKTEDSNEPGIELNILRTNYTRHGMIGKNCYFAHETFSRNFEGEPFLKI